MAGRSRCCLPGSPHPPGVQSIANYHPNAPLSSWRGGQPGARNVHGRGIQPCPVWKGPPPTPTSALSVSHSESAVPFCAAPTPHFISATPFLFLTPRRRRTARSEHPCTVSLPLLLNKRSHLWRGEGSAKSEIRPYVLNLRESLALAGE